MPRHRNLVLALLSPLAAICAACGGATAYTPPPPVPDFSLAVSSTSLSISQGDSSSAVTFSISAHNGFNAPVQISLANLPAGVTSNPASPFTAAPGTAASVTFVASPDAATGAFTISAQGVSGALLHSANLALAVAASNLPALPRTGFVRTDANPIAENPSGETVRRQIVYDAAHKNVFVANHAMNRLEVISVIGQSRGAPVAISGITSVDLSADGLTLWAGTSLNEIVSLDIANLAVKQRFSLNGISRFPLPFLTGR